MEFEVKVRNKKRKLEQKRFYFTKAMMENILLRIPLKPLIRFKLVSKDFCKTITELREAGRTLPLINSSCLALYTRLRNSSEVTSIIKLEYEGEGIIQIAHEPTYFDNRLAGRLTHQVLVDSMDGWLLFCRMFLIKEPYFHRCTELLVWDPILRRVILLPKIPEPATQENIKTLRFSMYRTSEDEVKIMCFCVSESIVREGILTCWMYSPVDEKRTGEWTQRKATIWDLWMTKAKQQDMLTQFNEVYNKIHLNGVRYKGYLCWLLSNWSMLMYDPHKTSSSSSSFIRVCLPFKLESPNSIDGMLWESEGVLYYLKPHSCQSPGFFLWSYVDGMRPCGDRVPWRLLQDVTFTEISPFYFLRPLVFNYELQTLYFDRDKNWLYAYSFETRKLSALPPPFSSLDPKRKVLRNRCCLPFTFSKNGASPLRRPSVEYP